MAGPVAICATPAVLLSASTRLVDDPLSNSSFFTIFTGTGVLFTEVADETPVTVIASVSKKDGLSLKSLSGEMRKSMVCTCEA